jgi:hypothetical protein
MAELEKTVGKEGNIVQVAQTPEEYVGILAGYMEIDPDSVNNLLDTKTRVAPEDIAKLVTIGENTEVVLGWERTVYNPYRPRSHKQEVTISSNNVKPDSVDLDNEPDYIRAANKLNEAAQFTAMHAPDNVPIIPFGYTMVNTTNVVEDKINEAREELGLGRKITTRGKGTRVVAAATLVASACSPMFQASRDITPDASENQPKAEETLPTSVVETTPAVTATESIPEESPTPEVFYGAQEMTILTVPGAPEGFGGEGDIIHFQNTSEIQDSLNSAGYAPILAGPVLSQVQEQDGTRLCVANLPDKLVSRLTASGEEQKIGSNEGVVSYGDPETNEVQTKAIGAISLNGLPKDLTCVNAVVIDEENPAGLGAIRMLLINEEGEIKGEMPAAFSGNSDINMNWGDAGPELTVDGVRIGFQLNEELAQQPPPEPTEEQIAEEIPQFLKEKWKSMGYSEALNEGGGYETKEMEINGKMREFLVWGLGFTEYWVDEEFIKKTADFAMGGDKSSGETVIPNFNEEGAVENIEKIGAWVHAINLGLIDRTSSEIDPAWYQRYLQYIEDNPDASYELEGYVPKKGKKGAYEIASLGRVDATLPVKFVHLTPVIEHSVAMEGPEKILGGSDEAPNGLDYALRSGGYYGLDIDDEGRLTSLQNHPLFDGKLPVWRSVGPDFSTLIQFASAEPYYRNALVSFAPAPDLEIYQTIFESYFSDPGKWERPHIVWGYPDK